MASPAILLFAALAGGQGGEDPNVYYGHVEGAQRPAELTALSVFSQIPEYQEIQRRGLDEDDAEYWTLLERANRKFRAAVRKVAERDGYDCVVERGTHTFRDPPDITQSVIDALEN